MISEEGEEGRVEGEREEGREGRSRTHCCSNLKFAWSIEWQFSWKQCSMTCGHASLSPSIDVHMLGTYMYMYLLSG